MILDGLCFVQILHSALARWGIYLYRGAVNGRTTPSLRVT